MNELEWADQLARFIDGVQFITAWCVVSLAIRVFKKLGKDHSPDL
jgi:hypothetical protein